MCLHMENADVLALVTYKLHKYELQEVRVLNHRDISLN